jgi:DNA-directed RNA polymerase subunit RPC12/RpoP
MRTDDVMCPHCGAGFRRIELWSDPGTAGEYRCAACGTLLEVFNDRAFVAYRLTIQPSLRTLREPSDFAE